MKKEKEEEEEDTGQEKRQIRQGTGVLEVKKNISVSVDRILCVYVCVCWGCSKR